MIKGVLFDMDGVIFDTEQLAVDMYLKAGKELGINISLKMLKLMRGLVQKEYEKVMEEWLGIEDKERVKKRANILWDEFIITEGTPVKKGVANLFEYLMENGYKTAIVTSSHTSKVDNYFNHTDLKYIFDVTISGDEIKNGKPDPEPYLKAVERLGLKPEECLVVEDSKNGIISASRAGCKVVMVPDLDPPAEDFKDYIDYIVENIYDVKGILTDI